MNYIPQIEPWIDDAELLQLEEVVRSTFITENKKTEEFLAGIRRITESQYAIATSNGTLALVAALLCAEIGSGDEVIVPDLTFIATSNAVRLVGATPVFCDVALETGCIDPSACESLITNKTKAIIPVHLYGQSAELDQLMAISIKYGIEVIEDAAESLGVFYRKKHTGTFGGYGIFSFFGNKLITCGEGGVVITKSAESLSKLYRVKNHGRDRKGIFVHDFIGYNFCFTDLQAAVGVAQLSKFDRMLDAKRKIFRLYKEFLSGVEEVQIVDVPEYVDSNYWFTNILVKNPQELCEYLDKNGIGSRRYFYPLHLQPCYSNLRTNACENSLVLYHRGLSLPSSVLLTEMQISYICSQIKQFYS